MAVSELKPDVGRKTPLLHTPFQGCSETERNGTALRQILFITGGTLILQRFGKSAQAAALSMT